MFSPAKANTRCAFALTRRVISATVGRFEDRGDRVALPDYRRVAPVSASYFMALRDIDPPLGGAVEPTDEGPWLLGQILLLPLTALRRSSLRATDDCCR